MPLAIIEVSAHSPMMPPKGPALLRLPAEQLRGARVLLLATTTIQSVNCPRYLATPILNAVLNITRSLV